MEEMNLSISNNLKREKELELLLEEYGMEEIIEGDGCYSYVWYKGTDLMAEGLQTWAAEGRSEVVRSVLKTLIDNPQWKK